MERSWLWKAALYGVLTVLAILYLVPTVVPDEKQPAVLKKYFQKKIQLGLDLQQLLAVGLTQAGLVGGAHPTEALVALAEVAGQVGDVAHDGTDEG